jgi:hypothetical protein
MNDAPQCAEKKMPTMMLVFFLESMFASSVAAQETWCWARDLNAPKDWICTYDLAQCQEIVRLRQSGTCMRPADRFRYGPR